MYRYNIEILAVDPPGLLASSSSACHQQNSCSPSPPSGAGAADSHGYAGGVGGCGAFGAGALRMKWHKRCALACCTQVPHRVIIRSAPAEDLLSFRYYDMNPIVKVKHDKSAVNGSPSRTTMPPHISSSSSALLPSMASSKEEDKEGGVGLELLAVSRHHLPIGGPFRHVGSCWVPLYATVASSAGGVERLSGASAGETNVNGAERHVASPSGAVFCRLQVMWEVVQEDSSVFFQPPPQQHWISSLASASYVSPSFASASAAATAAAVPPLSSSQPGVEAEGGVRRHPETDTGAGTAAGPTRTTLDGVTAADGAEMYEWMRMRTTESSSSRSQSTEASRHTQEEVEDNKLHVGTEDVDTDGMPLGNESTLNTLTGGGGVSNDPSSIAPWWRPFTYFIQSTTALPLEPECGKSHPQEDGGVACGVHDGSGRVVESRYAHLFSTPCPLEVEALRRLYAHTVTRPPSDALEYYKWAQGVSHASEGSGSSSSPPLRKSALYLAMKERAMTKIKG